LGALVGEDVERGGQQDRDRHTEVQRFGRPVEDPLGVIEPAVHVGHGALGRVPPQAVHVGEGGGVVAGVHDPGVGDERQQVLVHHVRRRRGRADVQELADIRLGRDRAHGPQLEAVQRLDHGLQPFDAGRRGVGQVLHHGAVGGEVRVPTADRVADPGQARDVGLDGERIAALGVR
jgi:hypothetical protein